MKKHTIKILGKLSDSNNQPIAKLRVEAWDKDLLIDDFVGEATSNEQGAFTISFTQSRYKELFVDRNPDIYFKIYEGGELIHNTENSVLWNIKTETIVAAIVIDMEKEKKPPVEIDKSFKVQGYIRKPDGSAFAAGLVHAYDKDLRTEVLLGKAVPNEAGYYEIIYSPDKLGKTNKGNADLQVRLIEIVDDKEEKTLIASEIIFNAGPVQEINLTLPAEPATKEKSEWERVNEQVLPLLKGQRKVEGNKAIKYEDLSPSELTGTDIDFIVSETNLDRLVIDEWVTSGKIFNDAVQKLNTEHADEQAIMNEYGWPVFYGIARQGVANNLDVVLQQPAKDLLRAINAAIFANRIPEMDNKIIAQLVKAIELIQRLQLLDPKQTIDSPFARVLSFVSVPVSRKLALDALTIVQEKGMENPDAVLDLVNQYPGEEKAVNSLVRSLRVYQLVNGHDALFQNLNARLEGDSHSIAQLATIALSGWVDIAANTSVSHAAVMEMQVNLEKQHPLTALGAKLYDGNIKLADDLNNNIKIFIKNNEVKAEAILKGQTKIKDDAGGSVSEAFLKNIGRFVRTGLPMEIAGHLMSIGLDTPALAIRYDGDFIREQIGEIIPFLNSDDTINSFIGKADKYVKGGLEFIAGGYSMNTIPVGYYGVDETLPPGIRENLPSLPGLFGDMDECMCKPCESMLGQPAYLVDLLNLLQKCRVKTTENGRTKALTPGLYALNLRRKDIIELPLSCENSENEIQHIDLVLRILEKAIVDNNGIAVVVPNDDEQPIREAYLETAKEIFPWQLPFELSKAETDAYLARLAFTRLDLLSSISSTDEITIAAETLYLSLKQTSASDVISEWDLLTGKNKNITSWNIYGLFPDINNNVSIIDPASGEILDKVKADDALQRVSVLLERTGLNLDEFEEVIATKFVGKLEIANRQQCKTSLMHLEIAANDIESILDRIHRFVRLKNKLTDWSFAELDAAIVSCGGLETKNTTIADREALLVKLALLKRLCNIYRFSIGHLIQLPSSRSSAYIILGITASQFALLKAITGFDWNTKPFDWTGFENFCLVADQIAKAGMTIDQAAEVLLTKAELASIVYPLPASIKTDVQLKEFLTKIQARLRSVTDSKPEVDTEQQVMQALTEIFDKTKAQIVVDAITKVSAVNSIALSAAELNPIKDILHDRPELIHVLGEWFPLISEATADALLLVTAVDNKLVLERYDILLGAIAQRRREMELVVVVSELSGLPTSIITPLLGERLLLDDVSGSDNLPWKLLLDSVSWNYESLAKVPDQNWKLLFNWADRLHRFINVQSTAQLDITFMNLADQVILGNQSGINWRNLLATDHTATTGPNIDWAAFEALLWLQHPDHLSIVPLKELFGKLQIPIAAITPDMLQPLANRLGLPVTDTFSVVTQICGISLQKQLMDPVQLKKAFNILLLVRNLGVNAARFFELADVTNNTKAAEIAKALVRARVGETDWPLVSKSINDPIRQQRRDAVVSYLVNIKGYKNANDLYEFYLIDPLVEPCMNTTKVLEAISAVQLFIQRILFGLEPDIIAAKELKEQWTWMRNYRVWEANRKVYLFPENWLFPELRDDKSSSFKQLESALGQGELNADLANEVFGQFLDDVAQMGQVEVLGMYEDISCDNNGNVVKGNDGLPVRRILYIVGRTPNPPYAYYWRKCIDFGSRFMEWSPWQRIELDIQGDHIMPFILGGNLHIAWPLIKFNHQEPPKSDEWEVKMAWSRHDGKNWRKASISRDFWSDKVAPFGGDERFGFSFRCEISPNIGQAKILVYSINETDHSATSAKPVVEDPSSWQTYLGVENNPLTAADKNAAKTFLASIIDNYFDQLPVEIKNQIMMYANIIHNLGKNGTLDGLLKNDVLHPFACKLFDNYGEAFNIYTTQNKSAYDILDSGLIHTYAIGFIGAFYGDAIRVIIDDAISSPQKIHINKAKFQLFFEALQLLCSCRVVSCNAWIRLSVPNSTAVDLYEVNQTNKNISYTCKIDGIDFPLKPGIDGKIQILKFGDQGSINCELTLTIENSPPLKSTVTLQTKIPQGKLASQFINFEFNGTQFEAKALGFNLNELRNFSLKSMFKLTRDDVVKVIKGDETILNNPNDNSQPWMNGYLEILPLTVTSISSVLKLKNITVFDPTAPSQYWAIPAATSEATQANIWHFSENEISCYIDLDLSSSLSKSDLLLYPDSYKEAALRYSQWSEFKILDTCDLQVSTFQANELPTVPSTFGTMDWRKATRGELTFDARMPYACYNWEVFFHAPLMVADQLSKQHKFEEAEKWLRYVFDPTSGEPGTDAKRFLKFKVFREMDLGKQVIDDLKALAQIAGGLHTDAFTEEDIKAVKKIIQRWREIPFRPFVIARGRQIAFLWRTLFAYLDNLLAWADSLYRRDTRESINEAVMIYVLAQKILGRRPQVHEGKSKRDAVSYNQLTGKWDDFANYWIDIGGRGNDRIYHGGSISKEKHPSSEGMLYFCMPFNDKIAGYWDTIEDRLFNIRHCRNIEGIERILPLTDPKIDPELLVRAVAAGIDLGDAINGLYAAPPHYRYNILAGRAADLCNEVKSLGAAMLAAIEKRDAEHIALLRSSNEINLLTLIGEVKKLQITEAEKSIDALRGSRKSISSRYVQYQRLLGNKDNKAPNENESAGEESMLGSVDSGMASNHSSLGLTKEENEQYIGFEGANTWGIAANISKIVGGGFHASSAIVAAVANVDKITQGSKVLDALGTSSSVLGDAFSMVSQNWHSYAEQQGMIAGHLRRRDEWAFQSNQALKELQQIDKQILANQIRIDITKKELNNHFVQAEQAQAVDEIMHSKFSNEQLYQWMVTQLTTLHSATYRLAYDMARTAERAAGRELGIASLNIIRTDYWDNLHSGLLAGEKLSLDIKRLEVAYLNQNTRELEITKNISLRQLDAGQIQALRATGTCDFNLPEWLFDMDFPGHYFRRIKSVSISIPCIAGPYSGVPGTLTLLSSKVRNQSVVKGTNGYSDDENFLPSYLPVQSIATSSAQNDNGLFEFNLRDERYLPFEGAGAISSFWRFAMPKAFPPFDYDSISDLILHVRYTARNSGNLTGPANTATNTAINLQNGPQKILLDLRRDFAAEWATMKASGATSMLISLDNLWFPALFKSKTKTLQSKTLWEKDQDWPTSAPNPVEIPPTVTVTASTSAKVTIVLANTNSSEAVVIFNYSVT